MLRRPARVAVVALASRSAGFAAPRRRRFGGALSRWVGAAAGGERDPGEVGGLRIVGVNARLMVFNPSGDAARTGDEVALANPRIVAAPAELEVGDEGCLSFPAWAAPSRATQLVDPAQSAVEV
ncbi:peptide deformylase [Aureococcus anophagefferens]|nr:peptide deformylase [Aureococcus anophagefferens]